MGGPADEIDIRAEVAADHEAIAAVVRAAFGSEAEARLVDAIRASDSFVPELSLVAVDGNDVVGHVMVSHVELRDGATVRRVASLSPLAVLPDRHAQGIGGALVRAVVARAGELGEPMVVLEGAPAYYGRFDFEPASAYGIRIDLPSWAPPEAAQVLRLPGYDPTWRGQIVYPPAFDDVIEH
jgi:putative acetyltransferase